MRVVFPAPFGPRRPNSSPSLIWVVTLSRAVMGPSWPPFPSGFFFRCSSLRDGLKIRERSSVSIATSIVLALAGEPAGRPPPSQKAGGGSDGRQELAVPGHVPGDSVPHLRVCDVREFGDLFLVVLEVRGELCRVLLEQFDCDPLDVCRPDISQVGFSLSALARGSDTEGVYQRYVGSSAFGEPPGEEMEHIF